MQTLQEITSRDNERVKRVVKLASSGAKRAAEGLFYAEGVRLCLDLAATLRPAEVYFTEKVREAHPEVTSLGSENFLVKPHVAEKLGETKNAQGLVCLFPLPGAQLDEMDINRGVLVCEAMQDPTNLGAVLRSAAAFGFAGAVLCAGSADPYSPRAVRASVGAVARLPLVCGLPFAEVAAQLKRQGVTLWAAALQGAKPLDSVAAARPFALCIGNEGRGLGDEALALCDEAVYIPMHGGVESLNAAVAASVLMHHFSAML